MSRNAISLFGKHLTSKYVGRWVTVDSFDPAKSLIQYVQSRGRARKLNSKVNIYSSSPANFLIFLFSS